MRALSPFRHQQFRVLAAGLSISVFGHGLWAVALVYQVRALGGGMAELAAATTALSIGLLACVLLGGVAADRFPRRRILQTVEAVDAVTVGAIGLLSVTGALQIWHLVVVAALIGASSSFFFPAYSALLPQILPPADLLAANGFEGALRPGLQQAAGPAVAGLLVAAWAPGWALNLLAVCHVLAFLVLLGLRRPSEAAPSRNEAPDEAPEGTQTATAKPSLGRELREGVAYTVRTPWLLATLLFACVSVAATVGPIEVLLPFVVSDQLGGDSSTFGFLLAWAGIGAIAGSVLTASRPLPRRYLTWMLAAWGFGTLPFVLVGLATTFWLLAAIAFVYGATGAIGMVIWGTLLQRRVPHHMLGRVSSLDFFVSLALMPVSMALAGYLGTLVPAPVLFAIAGVVSPVAAVLAWWSARLWRDEVEHPLSDRGERSELGTAEAAQ